MSHAASRHLFAGTLPFVLLALAPSVSAQTLLHSDNSLLAVDDAEITPDQRYAVFRQNNALQFALVYDLATGQLAAAPGTSTGDGLMGECLDGVAVTNTRGVVLGNRVMILDLTNLGNPVVSSNLAGLHPRDVAITPDGTIACVRGGSTEAPTFVGGQYLYDLATGAQIGFQPGEPNPYPFNSGDPLVFNVDGVEATNAHAVMLSYIDHGAGTPEARVTIWELHPSGGGPPNVAFETSTTAGTRDQAGAPYDLAITPDGTKAVVRSELEIGLYDLSVSPPALLWLRSVPGPFLQEALDAVEATNDRIVTISRFDSPHRGHAAEVDVLDMLGNDHFEVIPGSPHDLAITPNGERAVVRTNSHVFLYDIVNLSGGTSLSALSRASAPSVGLQYFGGLDSVVATDRFAVTISRAENLQDTKVYFWDVSGSELVRIAVQSIHHTRPVDIALTPDGSKVAVAGNSNVSVYDVATGAQLFTHDACPPNAFYPWCDAVTASADRVVANGQYGPQSGWIAIVDIARFAENYCVGAPNSTGAGARISAAGTASVGANDLKLFATDMPADKTARFYYGAGTARTPFGNGYQCVGGTLYRLPSFGTNEAGAGWIAVNYGALPAGGQITPGSTWRFQCVYRDPAAGGANANTTDGLRIVFAP